MSRSTVNPTNVALLAAVLAAPILAQSAEPTRARLRGRITEKSGKPWANARVTLQSLLRPDAELTAGIDRIEVRSDERGRFSARVLPGREYDAWAVTPPVDGTYRTTGIATVRAGDRLVLEETERPNLVARIRVSETHGIPHEDLVVRVRGYGPHLRSHELTLDERGEAVVPPVPGARCRLEVGLSGGVLHTRSVLLAEPGPGEKAEQTDAAATASKTDRKNDVPPGTHVIELPKLEPILVRVTSSGKPVAGARIYERSGLDRSPRAVTDAHGWAILRQRARASSGFSVMYLFARAPGFADVRASRLLRFSQKGAKPANEIQGAVEVEIGRDIAKLREAGRSDLTFELKPGVPIAGRVVLGGDTPAAGLPLLVVAQPTESSFRGQSFGGQETALATSVTTDAEGRFAVASVGAGKAFQVHALLAPDVLARLHPGGRVRPECWLLAGKIGDEAAVGAGTIDLSALRRIEFRLTLEDGAPARHAKLVLAGEDPHLQTVLTCDRLGRCEVLLPAGTKLKWLAVCEGRRTLRALHVEPETERVSVRLDPPVFVSGRVVNESNEPVQGARVYLSIPRNSNDPLSRHDPPTSAESDAAGRFRIAVPRESNSGMIYAYYRSGGGSLGSGHHEIMIQGEPVKDIELAIPGAIGRKQEQGNERTSGGARR